MTELPTMEKNAEIIENQSLSEREIRNQLAIFKSGIPFVNITAAAEIDSGIEYYDKEEQEKWISIFENEKDNLNLMKFVPASGAATRMFKFLHEFLADFNIQEVSLKEYLDNPKHEDLKTFYNHLKDFAFYDLIIQNLKSKYSDFPVLEKEEQFLLFVQEMLSEEGLNFAALPKGLIPFHHYKNKSRTAFEEHLYEAAFYVNSNGKSEIHFTVSEDHLELFKKCYNAIIEAIKNDTKSDFEVTYSFQKKKTDTVAATPDNQLFLDENGNPVFRPGGHGALIENLNELDADIIFIKNIDNVSTQNEIETIAHYKKMLAGRLLDLQKKIFDYVRILKEGKPSDPMLREIAGFIKTELKIPLVSESKQDFIQLLNRPVRICGVVENTGAPGGGPFLVKDSDGNESFQIVEMAEINTENPDHKSIVAQATHFNPVDLVCGIRNYQGEKFDLLKFINPESGFIAKKSYQGQPIKALERPGLWNGGMAKWLTVFVEVPLITFNPVKKVVDLLDKAHQPDEY